MKLKWKVAEKVTGLAAIGYKRQWPIAEYPDGQTAAYIWCEDRYSLQTARGGNHAELTVHVADYTKPSNLENRSGFTWLRIKGTFKTLGEAKAVAADILENHPEIWPPALRSPEQKAAG